MVKENQVVRTRVLPLVPVRPPHCVLVRTLQWEQRAALGTHPQRAEVREVDSGEESPESAILHQQPHSVGCSTCFLHGWLRILSQVPPKTRAETGQYSCFPVPHILGGLLLIVYDAWWKHIMCKWDYFGNQCIVPLVLYWSTSWGSSMGYGSLLCIHWICVVATQCMERSQCWHPIYVCLS